MGTAHLHIYHEKRGHTQPNEPTWEQYSCSNNALTVHVAMTVSYIDPAANRCP